MLGDHEADAAPTRQSRPPADQNQFDLHAGSKGALAFTTFSALRSASECSPSRESAELRIESSLVLETYASERPAFQILPDALSYPFVYSADDRIDLGRMLERQYPDPNDQLGRWARGFVRSNPTDTSALLADLNSGVAAQISYQSRESEGTQTPVETLNRGWGSCRDLAVLLIEAARTLGFGARVVTGYLYRASVDGGSAAVRGAGTTHAWADIYVPGSGWVAYDPTNGTIGGKDLIQQCRLRATSAKQCPSVAVSSAPPAVISV